LYSNYLLYRTYNLNTQAAQNI